MVGWFVCKQPAAGLCSQGKPNHRSCSWAFLPVSASLVGPAAGVRGWLGRGWQGGLAPACLLPLHVPGLRPPQPAGSREEGGKWGDKNKLPAAEPSLRAGSYHKRTALTGAAGGEPIPLSRASCPAHSAARPRHRSLADSAGSPASFACREPCIPGRQGLTAWQR